MFLTLSLAISLLHSSSLAEQSTGSIPPVSGSADCNYIRNLVAVHEFYQVIISRLYHAIIFQCYSCKISLSLNFQIGWCLLPKTLNNKRTGESKTICVLI